MNHNDDLALYLMGLMGIAAILSGDNSTAWIGVLLIIAGVLLAFGLELVIWIQEKLEGRNQRKKKHKQ